jgi:hypothetical protein
VASTPGSSGPQADSREWRQGDVVAVTGTDGDEDALGVTERLGDDDDDDEAGDVGARDDAVLAACVVLALAVVGGAVVGRCVVLGFSVGVVTTPTTVGVGVAGGRTRK